MNPRNFFQKISYLQYPLMLLALYYIFQTYLVGFDRIWENYNFGLLFMGLAISFSTLQTQLKPKIIFLRKFGRTLRKGK